MYQIGDKVVYPVHGAGVVEAIESREVAGRSRDYYILRLPYSSLRLMVPLEEAEKVGLREVMPPEQAGEILNILEARQEGKKTALEKWNRRLRLQLETIKSGNVYELAETVRDLAARDRRKPLAASEKKLLEQAREILFSELLLAAEPEAVLAERVEALLAR